MGVRECSRDKTSKKKYEVRYYMYASELDSHFSQSLPIATPGCFLHITKSG